jgi:hypothetical protein
MDPQVLAFSATQSKGYADMLPKALSPLGAAMDRLSVWRAELNLPDPGKAEEMGREVKSSFFSSLYRCPDVKLILFFRFKSLISTSLVCSRHRSIVI